MGLLLRNIYRRFPSGGGNSFPEGNRNLLPLVILRERRWKALSNIAIIGITFDFNGSTLKLVIGLLTIILSLVGSIVKYRLSKKLIRQGSKDVHNNAFTHNIIQGLKLLILAIICLSLFYVLVRIKLVISSLMKDLN